MSDTRFTLVGIATIFAGFLVLGVLGSTHADPAAMEASEFGVCHRYHEDGPPEEVDCGGQAVDRALFFALVLGLVGTGVACLVAGVRGEWDQKVRPEDMVGPGGDRDGGDGPGGDRDGKDGGDAGSDGNEGGSSKKPGG